MKGVEWMTMKSKPTIKIIATGGTFAGAGSSNTTTTGYKPGAVTIGSDEKVLALPIKA